MTIEDEKKVADPALASDDEFFSEQDGWDEVDEDYDDDIMSEKSSSKGFIVIIILLALLLGGGYYAFKTYGSKLFGASGEIEVAASDAETSSVSAKQTKEEQGLELGLPDPDEFGMESFDSLPMPTQIRSADLDVQSSEGALGEEAFFSEMDDLPALTAPVPTSEDRDLLPGSVGIPDESIAESVQEVVKNPEPLLPVSKVDTMSVPAVKGLQQSLDELSTRLESMEQKITTLSQDVERLKKAPAPKRKVTAKKKITKKSVVKKPAKKAPSRKVVKERTSTIQWQLRSAKPGSAWVSPKGRKEISSVNVGDTLPGIGRVTFIGLDKSGRWVVRGANGSIKQ